jgi:hypothetical protein
MTTASDLRDIAAKVEAIADQVRVFDFELALAKARAEKAEADAQRMGEENNRLCDENFELERKLKEAACV